VGHPGVQHCRSVPSPWEALSGLPSLLLNARRHASASLPPGFIDARSSAAWFDGFRRSSELAFGARQVRAKWRASSELEAPVVPAQTWLLRQGSRRHGVFDVDDVPSGAT